MDLNQRLRTNPDEHLTLNDLGEPIDARLTFDPSDGSLTLAPHHPGSGTPTGVHLQHQLSWLLPSNVRGDALAEWLERPSTSALLERIRAGHVIALDHATSNFTGRLTLDARAAHTEISEFLERQRSSDPDERPLATYEVWRAGDYLNDTLALTPELRGSVSIERIDALAREIIEEAATNGVWLDPSDVQREIRAEIDRASVTQEQHA